MAKYEGTQSIPAEWLDEYRGALLDEHPGKIVRKRYPYRIPKMQKYGYGVTPAQQKQRNRFLAAIEKFNATPQAERQRWYASMPPWGSLLWYFNWFLLSGINGVLGAIVQGIQVIRVIQHLNVNLPTDGTAADFATAVDPSKVIVLFNGNAPKTNVHTYDGTEVPYVYLCTPMIHELFSSSIDIYWSPTPSFASNISVSIIEYI